MRNVKVNYEGKEYDAKLNDKTGYYELELQAKNAGINKANIIYTDALDNKYEQEKDIQVFVKKKIKLIENKTFMWIFSWQDFSVKDIIELSNYEINIDEETNENSLITVLRRTTAVSNDIVAIKKNNEVVYWGIIDNINNENGIKKYQFSLKYITNLFNQDIELINEGLIKTKGIEDFIYSAIEKNFINSDDNFINREYLVIRINSHTRKNICVSNVENKIYNLHTWMTNCTQKYSITYEFNIEKINNKYKLVLVIENKKIKKELIDTRAHSVSNYSETFETDIISKVTVLTNSNSLTLFLLKDRTTTTDKNNNNRAIGKTKTVYTEKYEDANQVALDVFKSNSYNHNISFSLYEKIIKIGTPIAIKTKDLLIYDTYISSIKITPRKNILYQCGNIRTTLIEKLLKERNK